jgi:hypothetical protein
MKPRFKDRWIAWFALVALIAQVELPALRMITAHAGELRADAVLATALCSKPTTNIVDGIEALLSPWKQHKAKIKHQLCDTCCQTADFPEAGADGRQRYIFSSAGNSSVADEHYIWFSSVSARIPPSRGPPLFS